MRDVRVGPVRKIAVNLAVSTEKWDQLRRMSEVLRRFNDDFNKRLRHAQHCPRPLPIDGTAYARRRRSRRRAR